MNTESDSPNEDGQKPFRGARVKRPFIHLLMFFLLSTIGTQFAYYFYLTLTLVQKVGPETASEIMQNQERLTELVSGLNSSGAFEFFLAAQSFPMVVALLAWRGFFAGRLQGLGLSQEPRAYLHLAQGFGLGLGMGGVVLSLGMITGALSWEGVNASSTFLSYGLPMSLGVLLLHAFCEEVVYRGYFFQVSRYNWGTRQAVMISTAVFVAVHGGNPETGVLALFGTLGAGFLLALLVIRHGHIWASVGVHAAWNFVIGPLLSLPISGVPMDGVSTWSTGAASDFVLGGPYGPEAGLAGVLALWLAAAVVYRDVRRNGLFEADETRLMDELAQIEKSTQS